jgi:hypothetical protein
LWEEFTGAAVYCSSEVLGRQNDGGTTWALKNGKGGSSPALPVNPNKQRSWLYQLGASIDSQSIKSTDSIAIVFSEPVIPKAGSIRIYKTSDNSLIDSIDVTSSRVKENVVTKTTLSDYSYNMVALFQNDLVPSIAAAIGASETSKSNQQWASEISNNWIMTAEGNTYGLTSEGAVADDWYLYYATTPEYTPGSSDGTLNGGVNDRTVNFTPIQGLSKITIQPLAPLEEGENYNIEIDASAFAYAQGGSFPGVADHTSLVFSTVDMTAPSLTSASPSEDSIDVGISPIITLQFSEPVVAGGGKITIRDRKTNRVISEINSSDATMTTINEATVVINPSARLNYSTSYGIEIDSLAFQDASGNFFTGTSNTGTALDFTTQSPDIYSGAYYENQPTASVVAAVNGSYLPTKLRFKSGHNTTTRDGYFQFGRVEDSRIEVILTEAGAAANSPSNDYERGSNSFLYVIEEQLESGAWADWAAFEMKVLDWGDAVLVSSATGFGKKNADRITNFDPTANNKIHIDLTSFPGALDKLKVAKNSKIFNKAAKSDADFIYNRQTGFLSYNENGNKPGLGDGGIFAIFEDKPKIGLENFQFI